MTLQEAITHAEDIAKKAKVDADTIRLLGEKPDAWGRTVASCLRCAEEHQQLAEWLKELDTFYEITDGMSDEDEIFIGYLRRKMWGSSNGQD